MRMSLAEEARDVRQRIAARLAELEPLVREYEELTRVAAEMGIEPDEALAGERPASSSRRRRRQRAAPSAVTRGAEDLTARVLDAVRSDPGKTIADYATILGVAQTSLYRPVRELTDRREIVKRARQLFAE
jgi:hypothetical protein